MPDKLLSRERYGEAFWRAHHEAWRHSELNQREYCEAQRIPLKAFGNWRAKFKAEPLPPSPKLLYRRGGLSHTLSHSLSHRLSHDLPIGPIIPPAHEGRRRRFSEADKQQILEQAMRPDARLSEVARRYGIAERVLFRWKQEMKLTAAPMNATQKLCLIASRGCGMELRSAVHVYLMPIVQRTQECQLRRSFPRTGWTCPRKRRCERPFIRMTIKAL
jgi:hypothetical protein